MTQSNREDSLKGDAALKQFSVLQGKGDSTFCKPFFFLCGQAEFSFIDFKDSALSLYT